MELRIQHTPQDLEKRNVIYQIECLITNDRYIGETTYMKRRMINHEGCHSNSSKSGSQYRTYLYQDAKKYGWSNFRLSILAENVNDTAIRRMTEKLYQDKLGSNKYLFAEQNKDVSRKRENHYCKFTNGKEIKIFENIIDAVGYFNKRYKKKFNRTSVLKAISNNYHFKREWKSEFISKQEYLKLTGINSLFN